MGELEMSNKLGKLEKVDLREFWKDEARHFTPWLAREENIELLSETLGIEIEVDGTEIPVGTFKVDILAREINSNKVIIIENQLEKTDHDHLGKIITYASGLGAEIVVWVSRTITDEHRRAIDWLNDITGEDIAFFALEIELWRIDNSPPAAKFNIVCSPNEWAKLVKRSSSSGNITKGALLKQEFWASLKEYMEEKGTFLKLRKPHPQSWYSLAVGKSNFEIDLTIRTIKPRVGCELYISGEQAKKAYNALLKNKEEIEKEFGEKLDWQELPEKRDCRIALYNIGADIEKREEWNNYFEWLREKAEKFHKVFSKRVKNLSI